MKIHDVMTAGCKYVGCNDPITKTAHLMSHQDFGAVPVAEGEKLVGIVTDRDIVTRGVAEGRDLNHATTGELMSEKVYYCYDDDDASKIAANMGELKIRRMPVVTRDKRLVGMVSLGDLSTKGAKKPAGDALSEISKT